MPHQCTNCGHTFPDGSKEMLSGCPDCGGNKFQFKPAGKVDTDSPSSSPPITDPSSTRSPPETEGVGGGADQPTDSATEAPAQSTDSATEAPAQSTDSATEAPAQSTARSDVVTSEEVTAAGSMGPQSTAEESTPDSEPTQTEPAADAGPDTDEATQQGEESNLDQLRKELNNQFESIRIVSPGQYELNLMELYDRDEYIISLREDGRYVIEVPDGWGDS